MNIHFPILSQSQHIADPETRILSWCCCGSLVVGLLLCFLPSFSLTCSLPVWVSVAAECTPVCDQLIPLQLYLPGLSTTAVLDYYVPHGDFRVPLLSDAQSILCFCLCTHAYIFVGSSAETSCVILLCSPALIGSSTPAPVHPARLPGHLICVSLKES